MRIRWHISALGALLATFPAHAEEKPLSAIEWLDNQPAAQPVVLAPAEPDVAKDGSVADVAVTPLDAAQNAPLAPKVIGLVPSNITGLPQSLWAGTPAQDLSRRIHGLPDLGLPAARSLYFTMLLATSDGLLEQDMTFQLARIDALIALGALDPALALLEQMDPTTDERLMQRYFDASLLHGTEDAPCAQLTAAPRLAPSYASRVFCTARSGDWKTASLMLGTARVLDVIPSETATMLERFLDPDLFENEPALPRPQTPDALGFRIFEALGQRLSTQNLPRVFANADLRDVAGWKAQLEASERLARSGALPANRLLGIYSERRPAASGSVWDRVSAVQRFETALRTGSADAVSKTLPTAWAQMRAAGLGDVFATLFAEQLLDRVEKPGVALDVVLTSSLYESAALGAEADFLRSLSTGSPANPQSPIETAITAGFSAALPPQAGVSLGAHLLDTLSALQDGVEGDMGQLSRAISSLRGVGLEDTARRSALQLLILAPS
jgi:hypothetical protein